MLGPMRLATWNVNSIRTRVDRVIAFLQRSNVDVLAMQEIKCKPEQFPVEAFEAAGYQVIMHGLNQWNGVAVASRLPVRDGDQEVTTWSLYVPNGRELDHPHYSYKLEWLKALLSVGDSWLEEKRQIALVGDWNIAPYDHDVWDMTAFEGQTHVSPAERQAFFAFAQHGWEEVTRERVDQYTYWDYQKLRFPKNEGMRIDFIYASPELAQRVTAAEIDRDERKGKGASDHVPVIIDLA